jgi:hypothetical protein
MEWGAPDAIPIHSRHPISAQPDCVHRWKCLWLPHRCLWSGLGFVRQTSNLKGIFYPWKMVSNAISCWVLKKNIHFQRYSLLPALSLDRMIFAQLIEGSFMTDLFMNFMEGLLEHMNPFPNKNSVVVMDNAHIHRNPHIQNMIERK